MKPYAHHSTHSRGAVMGLHPLVAAAAVSVIALSGVGIATMMMNHSSASTAPTTVAAIEAPAPEATPSTPEPVVAAPVEVEKPVAAKPVHASNKPVVKSVQPAGSTQVAAADTPSTPVYGAPAPVIAQAPAICRECAVVEGTRELKVAGQSSGLGAIAGGVIGGLLGNRVGAGNGRAVATLAGAVGGGFAGNAIEKSTKAGVQYELTVRFEDGTTQTFKRNSPWPYGRGDAVRVVDNQVVSRG